MSVNVYFIQFCVYYLMLTNSSINLQHIIETIHTVIMNILSFRGK